MNKTLIILIVLSMTCLSGCKSDAPGDIVRSRLTHLAGVAALDCGWATKPTDYLSGTNCATGAFSRGERFFVQYRVTNTHAEVEEGIALDASGMLSHVWTTPTRPFYGGRLSETYTTQTCRVGSLRKLGSGRLTCNVPPHLAPQDPEFRGSR